MIYTSYEMIRDCRENRPEGWRYFVVNYVPAVRKLLHHYGGDSAGGAIDRILTGLRNPESSSGTLRSIFELCEPRNRSGSRDNVIRNAVPRNPTSLRQPVPASASLL